MKKLICCCVLLSIFVWGESAWAYFSESLIYTGPDEYEEVYEEGDAPTYASGSAYDKDVQAHAGWWSLGGQLHNVWDNNYQGWIYAFSNIEKQFQVIEAGSASINFSWEGSLQVNGNASYDNQYYLYGSALIEDRTLEANTEVDWYKELNAVGTLDISQIATFNYTFDVDDVGNIFEINLVFQTEVGLLIGGDIISSDDTLEFDSNLYNGLKIDSISGGIQALEGPPPAVPIPSTVWLFGSALITIVGVKRKFKE